MDIKFCFASQVVFVIAVCRNIHPPNETLSDFHLPQSGSLLLMQLRSSESGPCNIIPDSLDLSESPDSLDLPESPDAPESPAESPVASKSP